MAQRYSYLLCRLLHDVLTGSLEISSVSQSLSCYWVLYYSTYHLYGLCLVLNYRTNYEQYLETLVIIVLFLNNRTLLNYTISRFHQRQYLISNILHISN